MSVLTKAIFHAPQLISRDMQQKKIQVKKEFMRLHGSHAFAEISVFSKTKLDSIVQILARLR